MVCHDPAQCKAILESGAPIPEGDILGCITIEDVMECLIRQDIVDECGASSLRNELATALTLNRRVTALKELASQVRL